MPFTDMLANAIKVPIPPRTKDARDRLAFPNYEAHGQLTFEETLPSAGPTVDTNVSVRIKDNIIRNNPLTLTILG